jgi:hypothetical protein
LKKNDENKPPKKQDLYSNYKMHSVLTYTMENNRTGCINRDLNAVLNMKEIGEAFLERKERPEVFCREKVAATKKRVKKVVEKVVNTVVKKTAVNPAKKTTKKDTTKKVVLKKDKKVAATKTVKDTVTTPVKASVKRTARSRNVTNPVDQTASSVYTCP